MMLASVIGDGDVLKAVAHCNWMTPPPVCEAATLRGQAADARKRPQVTR